MDKQTVRHAQIIANKIKKEKYMCVAALESSWAESASFKMCKSCDPGMPSVSIFPRKITLPILGGMDQGVYCQVICKLIVKILEVAWISTKRLIHKYIALYSIESSEAIKRDKARPF